jgi:DNA-binding protein H-NS
MASYQQLQSQIKKLQAKAQQQKVKEMEGVIADIRRRMDKFGITIDDLRMSKKPVRGKRAAGSERTSPTKGKKVAAKYHDLGSGNTWSGRGLPPKWLRAMEAAGRKREEFLVSAPPPAAPA